jgi:hypothetical protein
VPPNASVPFELEDSGRAGAAPPAQATPARPGALEAISATVGHGTQVGVCGQAGLTADAIWTAAN